MVVHVTVLSADGNVEHPFQDDTTISTVKAFAFGKIKPAGISERDTYLTFAGTRITDERLTVSHFASGEHKKTAVFTLVWHNQAG